MAIYKFVSGKEIIRKVFRDLRPSMADFIHDSIEWMGEAMEHIGAPGQLCHKTCVIPIHDHKGRLPADLYYINQVALNTCVQPLVRTELNELSKQIEELNGNLTRYYESVRGTISKSVSGQYISSLTPSDLEDYDTQHATTLTQLNTLNSRMSVLENIYFGDNGTCLQPLAYGTSTFMPGGCTDCPEPIYSKASYVINCGMVQTNFAEGEICISYTAFMTDEECYPMIPDNISYREAMFWYITKKLLLQGEQLRTREINYERAEMMWQRYCTQARNAANYPDMARYQNFMDQWVRLIPNINRDLNFFENLNDREALQRDNY